MKSQATQIEKGLYILEEAILLERLEKLKPQLDKMRAAYGKIERVDPTGPSYKRIRATVSKLHTDDLQIMYRAEIKWLSYEAGRKLKELGLISGPILIPRKYIK